MPDRDRMVPDRMKSPIHHVALHKENDIGVIRIVDKAVDSDDVVSGECDHVIDALVCPLARGDARQMQEHL
jgi:hypothetical protein